jgi:endonuclease/exonuclease/phosphatase family metal-dependent hydrolase
VYGGAVRVLTWNLLHGRAVPPAGRDLFEEFAGALAGWEWDLALLQEVPPWWPESLGRRARAQWRLVLTARNFGLALRRAIALRWPDLIKSNGGGCNAILVRGERGIAAHRAARLGWWPERRWLHAVRLVDGLWVGNLHTEGSTAQVRRAASLLRAWAGELPAVLGGDFNLAQPPAPGFERAGGHGVDQVFVRGLAAGETRVLERGRLSDHAPVVVELTGMGAGPTPAPPAARSP